MKQACGGALKLSVSPSLLREGVTANFVQVYMVGAASALQTLPALIFALTGSVMLLNLS
jgi:hypothetical protein